MKVLYITGMDSTKYGGLEKYNIELAKRGIELLLIYNSLPHSKEYLKDIEEYKISLYTIGNGYFQRIKSIIKIIWKEKPNVVHYHFGRLVYVLSPLLYIFFPQIKQLYTIHCEVLALKKVERFFMNLSLNCMDLVICVSEGVKAGLVRNYKDRKKIIVSYLGVEKKTIKDLELKSKLHIDKNTIVLASIGFSIDVKGLDILAQSIANLNKIDGMPPYIILIIGLSQIEEKRFFEILRQLDITEHFISVGIRNDIDDFLNIADIYLQPSRTEAISLSIMEAMHYGLPIIATNVGGIPEVCINGENGFLFEKEDVTAFTIHLHDLILNSDLRRVFGFKSLEFSSKFNLNNSVNRLIIIYNSLFK